MLKSSKRPSEDDTTANLNWKGASRALAGGLHPPLVPRSTAGRADRRRSRRRGCIQGKGAAQGQASTLSGAERSRSALDMPGMLLRRSLSRVKSRVSAAPRGVYPERSRGAQDAPSLPRVECTFRRRFVDATHDSGIILERRGRTATLGVSLADVACPVGLPRCWRWPHPGAASFWPDFRPPTTHAAPRRVFSSVGVPHATCAPQMRSCSIAQGS